MIYGLGHWCKGLDVRDRANAAARTANAKRKEYERLYNDLKNSPQQNEIFRYEHLLKAKQQEIKRLEKEKQQTQQMAEVQGLGAWCRDADREGAKAERRLAEAERLLGEAKERYEYLQRRHKEYLPLLRSKIDVLDKQIILLKSEIKTIKDRIEEKKRMEMNREQMERMRKEKEAAQIRQKKNGSFLGMDEEETLILLGGTALIAYILIK